MAKLKEFVKSSKKTNELKIQEFEKDIDSNFHVDFIHAMANIRAANYGLPEMDWITVKIKAGRIVPALATTTATIAGLQTIEMLKFLKDLPVEDHKNTFLNLAVPSMMMGEPGAVQNFEIAENLKVNLWTRWDYREATKDTKLKDVLFFLEKRVLKSKLAFKDVFYGSKPIFLHSLAKIQHPEITSNTGYPALQKRLIDVLDIDAAEIPASLNLTVTFAKKTEDGGSANSASAEILENVPQVRIWFNEDGII